MKGSEFAFAKLNLSLDITERLPDGYHALRTVMQSVDFGDDVELEEGGSEWRVSSNLGFLPTGGNNLAAAAAVLFRKLTGLGAEGGSIRLTKRIPVCGGFGGGSSDAAAVLRLLNRLYGYPLSMAELETVSVELGADVPFCIRGGTVLAEGKGEKLTPLPAFDGRAVVLCRPNFSCSTPELFRTIDRRKLCIHPDTPGILRAIEQGDTQGLARRLFNVFEEVLTRKQSDTVWSIKDSLLEAGALGAVMTGSGSGIFGIFPSAEPAEAALPKLRGLDIECVCAHTTAALPDPGTGKA